MGVGVSGWKLAKTVSQLGHLGVVSGTALDLTLARRLQEGDPSGDLRRAIAHFPFPKMAARVLETYFIPGGKPNHQPFRPIPMHAAESPRELVELCMVGNFVEVYLAREGHQGLIGINFLEKVQLPHLPSIYGAMLAGVSYVLMGAGIPHHIPGVLDHLALHEPVSYKLSVTNQLPGETSSTTFDPKSFMERDLAPLHRPAFLPIIASNTLALMLAKKSNGSIQGFIIEGPTAGGHNAPPRGRKPLSAAGEPVYDEKDEVDLDRMRELGLPFWTAGGCATPEKLQQTLRTGGAGIQVGTAFALCEESGLPAKDKKRLLTLAVEHKAKVFTDPLASPTGFPFKVACVEGTLSDDTTYQARPRVCDLGYLREVYKKADGTLGYRCAAEPVDTYLAKGGLLEDTKGRKCLCNALLADLGLPQLRKHGYLEQPLFTCGDDLLEISRLLPTGRTTYTAQDVVQYLLPSTA